MTHLVRSIAIDDNGFWSVGTWCQLRSREVGATAVYEAALATCEKCLEARTNGLAAVRPVKT